MTIEASIESSKKATVISRPMITVLGVGGAGGNAVNNMIVSELQGAKFVVANTDAQALENSKCDNTIQLGEQCTKGLGAGASPEIGEQAAMESENEIRKHIEGSNMLFITAGMGGGTGTGASPVIAKIAKELGILTVGVVTKPFFFEGKKRMMIADVGLLELQKYVDTLIVIPNQNLFLIANQNTTFSASFEMADNVLHAGVRGITDLIIMPGLINLDFADIKNVMSEMGKAMIGTGEAEGEDRAIKAAEAAITNPLLDHNSMQGAKAVLINITGGRDMTLFEVDSATNRIREEVGDNEANIIFGSTLNTDLEGKIRVFFVATGIDAASQHQLQTGKNPGSVVVNKQGHAQSYDFGINTIPSFDEYAHFSKHHTQSSNHIDKQPDWNQGTQDSTSASDGHINAHDKNEEVYNNQGYDNQIHGRFNWGSGDCEESKNIANAQQSDNFNLHQIRSIKSGKVKGSIWKRMFNSLLSSETNIAEKDARDAHNSRQESKQESQLPPEIKELPTFFKKN